MKTMKRMAALVLCLSLLIGIPCAVQAVDLSTNNSLQLISVYAMHPRFVLDWTQDGLADNTVILYFNDNIRDAYLIKNNKYVDLFIEPYNATKSFGLQPVWFTAVDYYGTTAGAGKKIQTLQFTDTTQGFSYWRGEGATDFRLYIIDKKGTTVDGAVDGWANTESFGWTLKGAQSYTCSDGVARDAVIKEILFEQDHLTVENYARISDSKIMVKFSEAVKISALNNNGGSVKMELHATKGYINANGQPVDDASNVISDPILETWPATSFKIMGDARYVVVEFAEGVVAEAGNFVANYKVENETNATLNLHISEDENNINNKKTGEQLNNGLIDGIWSAANNGPLVCQTGKHRTDVADDTSYVATTTNLPAAWTDDNVYSSLQDALNQVGSGVVTMGQDVEIEERFLEVPAGVTLDLNGKKLTVDNIFAFGNIIDSTDGNGRLVISNDKTQAFVGLQETNSYLPLYDTNCYRFFSYEVINAGWRDHASHPDKVEENAMQFGIKVFFNSEKAYELLQADGTLVLDLNIDGRNIPYKFNASTMTKLYEKVTANEESWNKRSSAAITLTMSGLNSLESGAVITAVPTLSSAGVAGTGSVSEYTYTSAQ